MKILGDFLTFVMVRAVDFKIQSCFKSESNDSILLKSCDFKQIESFDSDFIFKDFKK